VQVESMRVTADHWLNALSFTLDLALGLMIAALVHVILDPPVLGMITVDGNTLATTPALTPLQRLVLSAAALALVRLLHSYVILKTQRPLKIALSRIVFARWRQVIAMLMKLFVVLSLGFSVFVISEPFAHLHLFKTTVPWLLPEHLTDIELSRTTVSITVIIPSTAVYVALLSSGYIMFRGLKQFANSTTVSEYILFRTFRSWTRLDSVGTAAFLASLLFYFLACRMVLDAKPANPVTTFFDWLIYVEWWLCTVSFLLSVWDYVANVRFYGIDLDFDDRAAGPPPAVLEKQDDSPPFPSARGVTSRTRADVRTNKRATSKVVQFGTIKRSSE
jgi:hypothetical protein